MELVVKQPSAKKRKRSRLRFVRSKVCRFCADANLLLDYKEPKTLRIFLTERAKIIPRRISGNCAKHQRHLTLEIKRARHIALLPFTSAHF
jgi:small subunit ribosomal protein S18